MNALREREINNNLERRLSEEQKLRGEFELHWHQRDSELDRFLQRFWWDYECHVSLIHKL